MEIIRLNTYKVAAKLPLADISSYFDLKRETGWKEYIKLNKSHLERIFKYQSDKKVYLYKYGCITFVDFNQDEVHIFLEYLKSSFLDLDSTLFSRYNESQILTVSEEGLIKLWPESEEQFQYDESLVDIAATILAKSIELYKIESELDQVLDEADIFISYLKKGKLRANTKKVVSVMIQCIRFKYNTVEGVRLLDRPSEFNTLMLRRAFDIFSEYYELTDRYNILSNRINVMDSITQEYFDLRIVRSEQRLILFEILLLIIFPLMYFLP